MPGIYDRLNEKLEPEEPAGGITPMDIVDLEAGERAVMLMLLRDQAGLGGVPLAAIVERFGSRPNLGETLRALTQRGWLIELGEPPNLRYRVNLRAKRGAGRAGLWAVLSDMSL